MPDNSIFRIEFLDSKHFRDQNMTSIGDSAALGPIKQKKQLINKNGLVKNNASQNLQSNYSRNIEAGNSNCEAVLMPQTPS